MCNCPPNSTVLLHGGLGHAALSLVKTSAEPRALPFRWLWAIMFLVLACVSMAASAQSSVIISEFLAHNTSGLVDEDGAYSDWIELYNGGTTAVNLGGWYLTDDAANLTKWAFPTTNIAAKGFMVVFASGKDRRVAGLPLHTSFGLGSDGEYLALVMSDGVTIATEFSPAYPKQFANISFGIGQSVTTTYFITSNSAAKVLVPTGPLSGNWTTNDFNDTSWLHATTGVGYETSAAGL